MKISLFFMIFSTLFLFNSSFGTNNHLKPLTDDQKLPKSICKITNDVTSSKIHTQDILIGNLGENIWSSTINDIVQCIDDRCAVVIVDLNVIMKEKNLRKASVVILTLNGINQESLIMMISKQHFSTTWDHMSAIICIVPNTSSMQQRIEILQIFAHFGFLNIVVAYKDPQNRIRFEYSRGLNNLMILETNTPDDKLLLPDKLKDMNGYTYRIAAYEQLPLVKISSRTISSHMLLFIDALSSIQNSRIHVILLKHSQMEKIWIQREMDLTLNTGVYFENHNEPRLLTYEKEGYCALVPIPPKSSLTQLIFIKPFDGLTWMFLALSVVGCVVVFWMFRGRGAVDSPWLVGYGMFVYFIGQGVNFSRRNRMVLTILLQLIILMYFVISSVYEGVITSFMIQPMHDNRLKTVDDLLASNYEILTDQAFEYAVRDDMRFAKMELRLNTSGINIGSRFLDEINEQKFVFIKPCDSAEYDLNVKIKNGRFISDYYYMLPEPIFSKYVFLEASYNNPFIQRLQYFMDLSFQAGLLYIWKLYSNDNCFKETSLIQVDIEYLKLEDLHQVFSILIIGYILSSLVLIIEIFLHDCLKSLNLRYLAGRLRNRINQMAYKGKPRDPKYQRGALYYIIHRHQKIKRLRPKRLKVRQVFVQPVNRDE